MKNKTRRIQDEKNGLSKAQEVNYGREFKRADRAYFRSKGERG